MKNYIQSGDVMTVPAPAAVSSGDLVIVGSLIGVAQADAASGADVAIVTTGVFELAKTDSQAWTVGAPIYWDVSESEATTVSTDNTLIGVAAEAVASTAGLVLGKVKID